MTDPNDGADLIDEAPMRTAVRCTAKSKSTGKRCRRAPHPGSTVCVMHGAAAVQVKRSARLRLAELAAPAVATLGREMVKAEKSSDRQRAANSILDRIPGYERGRRFDGDGEEARALLAERLRAYRDMPILDAEVVDE